MKEYHVYFAQVNQTCYSVKAKSTEKASKKATILWKRDNGEPSVNEIREE